MSAQWLTSFGCLLVPNMQYITIYVNRISIRIGRFFHTYQSGSDESWVDTTNVGHAMGKYQSHLSHNFFSTGPCVVCGKRPQNDHMSEHWGTRHTAWNWVFLVANKNECIACRKCMSRYLHYLGQVAFRNCQCEYQNTWSQGHRFPCASLYIFHHWSHKHLQFSSETCSIRTGWLAMPKADNDMSQHRSPRVVIDMSYLYSFISYLSNKLHYPLVNIYSYFQSLFFIGKSTKSMSMFHHFP